MIYKKIPFFRSLFFSLDDGFFSRVFKIFTVNGPTYNVNGLLQIQNIKNTYINTTKMAYVPSQEVYAGLDK